MLAIICAVCLLAVGLSTSDDSCGTGPDACDPKVTVRSYDGSCNNIHHPKWGSVKTLYDRLLPAVYGDGEYWLNKFSKYFVLSFLDIKIRCQIMTLHLYFKL